MIKKYQDFVIKDGKFVGEFEKMYQEFDDPWNLAGRADTSIDHTILMHGSNRVRMLAGDCNVIEIGCGLGHSLESLEKAATNICGIDISKTAVKKAQEKYPHHTFHVGSVEDFMESHGECADIDVDSFNCIVMSNVTWYILESLESWKSWLHENWRGKYLLHLLAVYPRGEQKYGDDFFTNEEEINSWWGLNYLEHGYFVQASSENMQYAYFLAKV